MGGMNVNKRLCHGMSVNMMYVSSGLCHHDVSVL